MHIYIGSIIWRDQSFLNAEAMARFYVLLEKRGIAYTNGTICGDSLVSRARSIAASNFLRSEADVLLMIDGDIVFCPEDALALCEKALELHMVGGIVMKRWDPAVPAAPLPAVVTLCNGEAPVETQWLGGAFTAVSRAPFEKLVPMLPLCAQGSPAPFYPFYQPMIIQDKIGPDGFVYLSEDWSFCEIARQVGFHCYIDPTIRLGHLGQVEVRVEDMARPARIPEQALRLRTDENDLVWLETQHASPPLASP